MTLAPALPRLFAQRALQTISWAGLAFSLAVLIVSAPHLLAIGGGAGLVLGNIAQFAWTLALLLLVFGRKRTVGARAIAGAALAGFFGIASLAVLAGKPLVDRLGTDNDFVPVFFAPVSEELIKLLPAALFLLLATRSRRRPSACDAVILGFTAAAGFAIYENILFARGTSGGWFSALPLSLVLPTIAKHGPMVGSAMLSGGHAVYTGLATLGLAVTVIYGRRSRLARFALPFTLLLVMLEHATVNRIAMYAFLDPGVPLWAQLGQLLTLHGYLSSLLFIAGVGALAIFEKRVPC